MNILPRRFFERDVIEVARDLLGRRLVSVTLEGRTEGRIVETEAYLPEGDSASHAWRGPTKRNASMFGPPGHAYVYPIHARHCLNAVTGLEGVPSAVLIRAAIPGEGVGIMARRRGLARPRDLARGPARLCEAFGIGRAFDGHPLFRSGDLYLTAGEPVPESEVLVTPRIGVTSAKDLLLRFLLADDPFVSGPLRTRTRGGDGVGPEINRRE